MKDNLTYSRTYVYNINYHVVWSVKYRKPILTDEIATALKQYIQEIASEKGFLVYECEIGEQDHVHCFISTPPKLSITDIVKYLKGITGRKLYYYYPEIKDKLWKGQLWNHSYYVETIGSISEDAIRKYIQKQSTCY